MTISPGFWRVLPAAITEPGYFSCMVVMAEVADYQMSGGSPIAFFGATFRELPWEIEPPEAAPAPLQAAPATPVSAQPTFTG